MEEISHLFETRLIQEIEDVLWKTFEKSKYKNVEIYLERWQEQVGNDWNGNPDYDFYVQTNREGNVDVKGTLRQMSGEKLLKIAIDLGIETPDFIPSIPTFRNKIKSSYKTASATFEKAFKQIEADPSTAVGLANSALESIIKKILKDKRISSQVKNSATLYALSEEILKIFHLYPNLDIPEEIKKIGSSLLNASQGIESLRSTKVDATHGKNDEDYIIDSSIYTYFQVNAVSTVGLFLINFYETKFPKEVSAIDIDPFDETDNLPF